MQNLTACNLPHSRHSAIITPGIKLPEIGKLKANVDKELPMKTSLKSFLFITTISCAAITPQPLSYAVSPPNTQQLENLEPASPVTLPNPPFQQSQPPENLLPISDVLKKGKPIAYDVIADLPQWNRPSYLPYWHSTYGRWSYVPNRIHFAKHRLFTSPTNASVLYDFTHNVGIVKEMENAYHSLTALQLDKILVVVMNTDVKNMRYRNQQVVIEGKPVHSGLKIVTIDNPAPGKPIYFQLSTSAGDEIDYSIF
ncbi:hypothetical protein NDS46_14960 [Paenibacillus thiaminolyticus]|uniref:hypothetical protein n=1 Tax=Paenibacillus thiaminolyticus TaxID=49283 RepID=UPI0023307B07|nr:hypothetical protein [Paenibacillus thiaminolyticus]WCF11372.1 hypothetical protein NDS46_14960 [Paenibacillus thiaminolyticus]